MAFKCLDCGNTSSKRFPSGACPACDSFNVRSISAAASPAAKKQKPKASKEKIALLIVFWALFLYGLWDNYLKEWLAN